MAYCLVSFSKSFTHLVTVPIPFVFGKIAAFGVRCQCRSSRTSRTNNCQDCHILLSALRCICSHSRQGSLARGRGKKTLTKIRLPGNRKETLVGLPALQNNKATNDDTNYIKRKKSLPTYMSVLSGE